MKIFETHAHLDFPDFDQDRDALIRQCRENGVEYIINVGIDKTSTEASIKLAEKYDFIYATAGFHPHAATHYNRQAIATLAQHPKVIALGEIGLDFFRDRSPRDVQKQVFADQIQLALDLDLPLVIHDREAHRDCLEILDRYKPEKVVFHCFSGDAIFAEEVLSRGWNLSFTGNITYKNNHLPDVICNIPLEKMFIETDSPFLSPHPRRGKRNSPLHLRYIIEKLSELKGISPKQVAEITYNNALQFFFE